MKTLFTKIKKLHISPQKLVARKHYLEFFVAILSIPVLITVIILNINSIRSTNKQNITPTPNLVKEKIYVPLTITGQNSPQPSPSISQTTSNCLPGIGEINIISPSENETLTENPVNIVIKYDSRKYCAVVWSHSINSGSWSEYDDKSIAIYNPPQGRIRLDLRVKSIVNGDEEIISRTFYYKGNSSISTPQPTTNSPEISSSSAT